MVDVSELTPRQREITRQLNEHGFLATTALADSLGVSDMTIRRDARQLEQIGAAQIVHGGLMLPHGTMHTAGFAQRAQVDADAKLKIARACARLVGRNERIIVDAGTTAYEVARALPASFAGTLITHSAPVIQLALNLPNVTTICIGGELLPDSQAFIGDLAVASLQGLRAETAFIGAAAVGPEGIYIERNLELRTKKALMETAERVILVVSAEKMGSSELVYLGGFDSFSHVVTDAAPPAEIAAAIRGAGTDLIVAD